MRFPILVLSLTAALILPLATQAGITSMREPLFGSADAARERADALDARRLAPISYRDATENYQRADSTFERAGSVDTIRRYLSKAEQAYNKSVEAAEIARTALDATLQAREDALASEAYDYAEDDWEKGETNFASAARSLERGSIRSAERYAEKSESAYRSGELMAIKANYLTETKILIEQAEKLKAERYAPTSLNNARLLLQNAENGLNENRYDTDRPRSLATDAKHNALHAIYVSKLERSIRDRKASLESVLLTWEASIGRLGDALDTPVYFDDGETKAIDTLLEELELLKDREAGLAQQLADRDVELAALLQQTDKMQELLGGGNQTIEELEVLLADQKQRLEQQARHRERFATVETLFDPTEADVFRQGDTVIIRLVGLNFDSGVSRLEGQHLPILATLEKAISEFPESYVVVEGHTDAFGSDEQNQVLSQARADSVVRHLLDAMPISPTHLSAAGYGESRPVANNETEDGRRRNRRIDVVIRPDETITGAVARVYPSGQAPEVVR
jgi:outer membrane protein OmpA-like peptidoglycan-associated protein